MQDSKKMQQWKINTKHDNKKNGHTLWKFIANENHTNYQSDSIPHGAMWRLLIIDIDDCEMKWTQQAPFYSKKMANKFHLLYTQCQNQLLKEKNGKISISDPLPIFSNFLTQGNYLFAETTNTLRENSSKWCKYCSSLTAAETTNHLCIMTVALNTFRPTRKQKATQE